MGSTREGRKTSSTRSIAPKAMTVDTLPTMPHHNNSRDRSRMIPKPAPLNMHTPIGQHMPSRYESSEEEVSGSDTTNRDDRSCSSTDADSDTGKSSPNDRQDEDDGPARRHYNPERAFSFLTSPNRDSFHSSRPASVYTVRRISGLTLRTQQEDGTSIKTSRSNSPSTTRLSVQREDGTASSIMFEAEPRAKRHSCYSDTTPSDDDLGPPDSPLVATPVTYRTPGSRPNIVSITPPPKSPTHSSPPSLKKQMAEHRETPMARKKSNASSNGISMKTRLARLRMAKHQQRLISSLDPDASPEYSPPVLLSPTPKPISTIAGWASNMSAPVSPSTLGPQAAEENQMQKPKQKPSRTNAVKKTATGHHAPEHPVDSRRSFIQPDSQKLLVQERSNRLSYNYIPYRKPATESHPLPTNMERTPSPPPVPQATSASRRSSIRSYYESQFLPKANTGRTPTGSNNKSQVRPQARPQPQQQPAERAYTPTRPRSRTRSISSIASTSSKFSIPAFDSASLKGIAQRYQHRYQNQDLAPPSTSSSSTNSVSGSTYTASLSPDSGRRPSDCSMLSQHSQLSQSPSAYLASKSTTNLSTYTTAPPPSIQGNDTRTNSTYMGSGNSRRWSRNPATSSERLTVQQQHSRNKSFKWGESVSQASSKAMTGLGFMLKKRTA